MCRTHYTRHIFVGRAAYETIVIDAQYYAPDEIAAFKGKGQEIRRFCLAGKYHCFISDSLELEHTEGM